MNLPPDAAPLREEIQVLLQPHMESKELLFKCLFKKPGAAPISERAPKVNQNWEMLPAMQFSGLLRQN
jgi:hypothetical protein